MRATTALCGVVGIILVGFAETGSAQAKGKLPNGRPFQLLQAQIDDLNRTVARIGDLQIQVDGLAARVARNEASVDDLRSHSVLQAELIGAYLGEIGALKARIAAGESDATYQRAVAKLQGDLIAQLTTRLAQLDARLATNAHNVQLLFDRDQAQQTLIAVLQEQTGALRDRISALESAEAIDAAQIASLRNQLNALTADLDAALQAKQNNVTGFCPLGSSIRQINANGTVACEPDDAGGGAGHLAVQNYSTTVSIPASASGGGTKSCPSATPSQVAVGGGFSSLLPNTFVLRNDPTSNGWQVLVTNQNAWPLLLTVTVTCAAVVP
jgi:hypothetical protein